MNFKIGVKSLTRLLLKLNCKATNGVRGKIITHLEREKNAVYAEIIEMSAVQKSFSENLKF